LSAYNEGANIRTAVECALEVLQDIAQRYEVIIVNDGSRDNTGETAQELVTNYYPHIRLLTHIKNHGYGAALRNGFSHAKYSLLFYTDSDNQFDISELKAFVPLMSRYDMVTGFRVYRYDPCSALNDLMDLQPHCGCALEDRASNVVVEFVPSMPASSLVPTASATPTTPSTES
jgi:glycosyltransferase involved in cell wall biosynthesis